MNIIKEYINSEEFDDSKKNYQEFIDLERHFNAYKNSFNQYKNFDLENIAFFKLDFRNINNYLDELVKIIDKVSTFVNSRKPIISLDHALKGFTNQNILKQKIIERMNFRAFELQVDF
jgi:hypothetical protein